MAVTIKQIAQLSGVSRGTVDRVLNGRGNVKPAVAERIRLTAKELGYRPNKIGKALAYQSKPLLIGVVRGGDDVHFFDDVVRGALAAGEELADFGVRILVESMDGFSVEKQLALLERLEEQGVTGIAIAPLNSPLIARKLDALMDKGVQVVTYNSDIVGTKRLCFVGCDYIQSGRCAAGLMGRLRTQPSQVAAVCGSLQMLGHSQRIDGFRDALARDYPHIELVDVLENSDNDTISHRVVEDLLRRYPNLSGLYFAAAGVTGGARAVCEQGRRGALTIVTCDDFAEIRSLLRQDIVAATVCQQPFEQGYRPVKLIFERIVGKVPPLHDSYYTESQIKIKENL